MQEKQFWCLRNPCENTFSKLPMFFFVYRKKSVQNMLGYWPYATHKKIFFFIFFCQNANITIRYTPKWKVASHHLYYKKLETIRNKKSFKAKSA